MRLTNLRVNHVDTPLGFAVEPTGFSWKVEDAGNAKKQRFARIRVMQGENMVYDSGEDVKANSLDYRVDLKLEPKTRYSWSVEFDCELPRGMKVRLTASEILQDGCFYHDNLRTAKTEFTFISDGRAAHVRPHFTFFGFRYMKVEYLEHEGNVVKDSCDFIRQEDFSCGYR